ncbi:Gfo/Idh/MocA family oxidoreductase [Alkalilimnicola ehrlichii]|uniref:Gfo/Idh/MocA family oxidoreductase n=1 Tax=Alkalilimnicola ehrlichii TaxID=351052 RepID=UPI002161B84A|nr:Gfo/Idh/MocA family oxidoreductase [Alkalilimnicola ehrlichii]
MAAGRRAAVLRALRYGACAERYLVTGLVDPMVDRLESVKGEANAYTDLATALEAERPDVAVVCVNEEFHWEALRKVLACRSIRHVVCEKPLTKDMAELQALGPAVWEKPVSVNFCERYSYIMDDYRDWLREHDAEVSRIEFFWGKYRVRDPRPTMGVLSELSHPLDLARVLLASPASELLELSAASSTFSDFSVTGLPAADDVSVTGSIDGVLVSGKSSFLWDERKRRIVVYACQKESGNTWQVVLNFDAPRWDDDSMVVYEINPCGGERQKVAEKRYRSSDLDPQVRHINKLYRYLLEVADTLAERGRSPRFADAADARWAQVALDEVASLAGDENTRGRYAALFGPEVSLTERKIEAEA